MLSNNTRDLITAVLLSPVLLFCIYLTMLTAANQGSGPVALVGVDLIPTGPPYISDYSLSTNLSGPAAISSRGDLIGPLAGE